MFESGRFACFFCWHFRWNEPQNTGRCTIKELPINEEIRVKEVRLINNEGEQLGVMSTEAANQKALDAHLDLVLMSPQAKPPVCKMMDYGKYRYDLLKKQKEQRKNQKNMEVREIRLSPRIDDHDLETKAKKAIEMLSDGDKVKVSVRFRGRELGHTDLGREVLDDFVELTAEVGEVDKKPAMEGRNMIMFLVPRSDK